MTDPKPTDEQLRELARRWFADAREQSAKDNAEVTGWKKQHRKWTGGDGGGFGDSSSGDGGGGCGGGD